MLPLPCVPCLLSTLDDEIITSGVDVISSPEIEPRAVSLAVVGAIGPDVAEKLNYGEAQFGDAKGGSTNYQQ